MCGDNFNTVKKGPTKVVISAIEPPPQFQVKLVFSFIYLGVYAGFGLILILDDLCYFRIAPY